MAAVIIFVLSTIFPDQKPCHNAITAAIENRSSIVLIDPFKFNLDNNQFEIGFYLDRINHKETFFPMMPNTV